jgi:hypothetical protein
MCSLERHDIDFTHLRSDHILAMPTEAPFKTFFIKDPVQFAKVIAEPSVL